MINVLSYLVVLTQSVVMGATHYGESYNGRQMACVRGDLYSSNDANIAAVGPTYRYGAWPCGTNLEVQGPHGTIMVTVRDYCPGCSSYYPEKIDLSEAGIQVVCGGIHSCNVTVTKL